MPDRVKEKLVELLEECDGKCYKTPCITCDYHGNRNCSIQMQVDNLISNGVTVNECVSVTERLPDESGMTVDYIKKCICGTSPILSNGIFKTLSTALNFSR